MKTIAKEDNINILNKIKHKPILLESIFSFVEKRFYIIINFISKDKTLKSDLKQFFDKTKRKNSLSKELNINIKKYIFYRKILEKNNLKDIIEFKYTSHEFNHYLTQDINNNNKGKYVEKDSPRHNQKYKNEIYNFIAKYQINKNKNNLFLTFIKIFINNKLANSKKKYYHNNNIKNNNINFYYSDINDILDYAFTTELNFSPSDLINFMERNNNFIFFFEFFIFIYWKYFKEIPKNLFQIYSFLQITQYFNQNNININNIEDINEIKITPNFIEDYYYKVKKYSIIERIIVKFKFYYDYKINLHFLFSLLSLE